MARDEAPEAHVVQADLSHAPVLAASFDLIWVLNTVNHLPSVGEALASLSRHLRPGGHLAVAQSHFVPEMLFAWDERLERAVTQACHAYYRDKYSLETHDTNAARRLLGAVQDAGLREVRAHTTVIERRQPLAHADHDYFLNAIFRGYWGPKIEPYLEPEDWAQLQRLCDPASSDYCLSRPDFHHLQTITVVTGTGLGSRV